MPGNRGNARFCTFSIPESGTGNLHAPFFAGILITHSAAGFILLAPGEGFGDRVARGGSHLGPFSGEERDMAKPINAPIARKVNVRGLVIALDGKEKPYDVYRFSRNKRRFERPKHNPFKDL